jgi:uncharacterized protein YbjT (DUF2867 family)
MDAAEAAGVRRYVMVSYFGAGPDHGTAPESTFFPYADAKAAADEYLQRTSLDWTILGPSALTDDPGTGAISTNDDEASSVPRQDVARVIAAVLSHPGTIGTTLRFNSGPTPIGDAVTS